MAVAEAAPRRPWWTRLPASWIQMSPPDDRERERERLDETGSMYRRRWEDNAPAPAPKVQVPLALVITVVIWSVGQLIGGIWWAATLQANQQHEIADRAKEEARLWQTIETYRLQVEALRLEVARSNPRIKINRSSRDDEEE